MYLTGQHFPVQDANSLEGFRINTWKNEFTATSENLWNNRHRCSPKIAKFFHNDDQAFKSKPSFVLYCRLEPL